jgi:hypothetical protein
VNINWHGTLVDFVTWFVLLYFILLNLGYLTLNLISIVALRKRAQ